MDNKIEITMFGLFSMKYGNKTIDSDIVKSEKLITLLAYLLYYHNRIIPSNELIDLIWSYEDIENPIGALKNLIYRLRTLIKKELGIHDLIMTGTMAYYINEKYELIIDAQVFYQFSKQLLDSQEQVKIYNEIIDLYKGRFLNEVDGDFNALSRSAGFHSIYITKIIEYAALLENQKEYSTMGEVARLAITIDSFEESLYIILIKSLWYQGFYQQAVDVYKETAELLYRALGTNPSDEMKKLYELIKKEKHTEKTEINEIQKNLIGAEKHGAYLCEYGTFRDIYNLQWRMMERVGVCTHLCSVTVDDNSRYETDKQRNKEYIEKTMQKIQHSLVAGLRVGDIVSRFSTDQFVVLLPMCDYENASMVMDRTLKKIKKALNNKKICISISITEVASENLEDM